jgi:hypothetical protein
MRQSIAVIVIAFAGLSFLPYGLATASAFVSGDWIPAIPIGIFALATPERFVAILDSPERPVGETITADLIFGAVALWVFLDHIPALVGALVRMAQEVGRGEVAVHRVVFWMTTLPDVVLHGIAVFLAIWAFFGRARLARAWHRIHPMTQT